MQNLTEIPSSEKLVDSRARINNNFVSVQSNFSGTAFPTLSIEVGQTCFRTDLAQKFELKSVNPDVWILIADLNKTYTNQEYVDQQDALKANKDAPTFTGTVVLPSTTSIGNVTSTEIGYLDGVTSAIQGQIDSKAPKASPTFTGTVSGTFFGNITGNVTGNVSGSSSSCTGNASTATNATTAGSCTGNSATATKLATARTINGVSFDGTANITVAGGNTVSITAGTIANGGTIPLPSGYTREQCKYAVWPHDSIYACLYYAGIKCQVVQATGVVTCQNYYQNSEDSYWYTNATVGYLCIGVK